MGKYVDRGKAEPTNCVKLTNVQRLMDIINSRIDSGTRKPVGMPDSQQEGAQWFIKLLEPRQQFEIDEQRTISKHRDSSKIGDKYWFLPYQDRLADCLITFYKLPHKDQQQIITWSANKIMWRGDSMKFMRVRAKVTPDMIDKDKLLNTMRSMCRG